MMGFLAREKGFLLAVVSVALVPVLGSTLLDADAPGWGQAVGFVWLFGVIALAANGVVHHAEALAHKLGEPFGTLILTLSAVGLEVLMISVIMLSHDEQPTMARDTVYAVLMLIVNGLIGISLLVGGLRHVEQDINLKSSNTFFSMLLAFSLLCFIVPMGLTGDAWNSYELFLIPASVVLYGLFLRAQTHEHAGFFVLDGDSGAGGHGHDSPLSTGYHVVMLVLTLVPIIILAKSLATVLELGVAELGLPLEVAGLVIAVLILSPEGLTAVRAGLANDAQRVLNICLGSALATIGLTIPVVLTLGLVTGKTVVLALAPDDAALLIVSLLIAMNTYAAGRTNRVHGAVHFVLFAAYIILLLVNTP